MMNKLLIEIKSSEIKATLYSDADYADLKRMIGQLYQEDPEGEPMDDDKIDRTINAFKKNLDKIRIYTIKSHGENIGYAILTYFWSNEMGGDVVIVDELYVQKESRGMGVATEFLAFVKEIHEDAAAIQLEVTPSNQRALEYYRRLGFSPSLNTHMIALKKVRRG